MQFTCNRNEITKAITDTMAAITCGNADQPEQIEENVTELATKPEQMGLDTYRAVRRAYRAQHPPKPLSEKQKEKRRQANKRYRQKHPEKVAAASKRWKQSHKEQCRQHQRTFWMKKAAELARDAELEKRLQCSNMRDNCDECQRATTCEAEYDAMLEAVNLAELAQNAETAETR